MPRGVHPDDGQHPDALNRTGHELEFDESFTEPDLDPGRWVAHYFANLQAVAEAAGTALRRAVRIGVFLSPRADADEYNRIYAELIDSSPPPARTTVRSDFASFATEIDAICLVP